MPMGRRASKRAKRPILGLLENGVCKSLPLKVDSQGFSEFTYLVLAKGADLPLDGIHLAFVTKHLKSLNLGTQYKYCLCFTIAHKLSLT